MEVAIVYGTSEAIQNKGHIIKVPVRAKHKRRM